MRGDQELSFEQLKFELPVRHPREDLPAQVAWGSWKSVEWRYKFGGLRYVNDIGKHEGSTQVRGV